MTALPRILTVFLPALALVCGCAPPPPETGQPLPDLQSAAPQLLPMDQVLARLPPQRRGSAALPVPAAAGSAAATSSVSAPAPDLVPDPAAGLASGLTARAAALKARARALQSGAADP